MTETDQEQFSAPASIGAMLRQARERRGETLSDVAHALKLSPYQVEALEQERYDVLPGAAFVRGFLRNFARHVHLDLDARIAALDLGGGGTVARLSTVTNASGEIPVGGERARKGVKPALAVIVGMALALGAGWYFDWFKVDEQPQTTAPRALVEPVVTPAPLTEAPRLGGAEAPPLISVPEASDVATVDLDEPAEDGTTDGLRESAESAVEGDMGDPNEGAEVAPETRAATEDAPPETAVPAASAEETELAPGAGRLSFALRGESWIQVRDRDGVALFTGTGGPGSSRVVQGQPPFAIVVGNAAMVSLEFNGQPVDLTPHTSPGGVARMTVQ